MAKTDKKPAQKSDTKSLSPKQAKAKFDSILSGIDNNSVLIAKKMSTIDEQVKQLAAVAPIAFQPTAAKPAPAAKVAAVKTPKPAKVPAAKPAKEPKVAKPAQKTAPKASAKPAAKTAVEKIPLKQVLKMILQAGGNEYTAANELYKTAIAKYGSWSRQSLYNALKDTKTFVREGDNYKLAEKQNVAPSTATGEKDEADRFVAKVEGDTAVSQMA